METLAAKVPPDLNERIEDYRDRHDLNKSQTIRRLIEDGFDAEEIRQENAQLRQNLEERKERERNSITIPEQPALAVIGFLATVLVLDGTGIISLSLTIGVEAVGIIALATVLAYAVYRQYSGSPDRSKD